MTLELEELVRQAQRRQAERAADPDAVRAALPGAAARLARRRRIGTLVASAATAVLVAAVAVPVIVVRSAGVRPGGSATAAPPADLSTPLRYRPTWLPPGFAERSRVGNLRYLGPDRLDGAFRVYSPHPAEDSGDTPRPSVAVVVRKADGPNDPAIGGGTPVTVNGRPGAYHAGEPTSSTYVEWRADTDWVVSVEQRGADLSEAELLRIAESVRPDEDKLDVPLRLGWLPDGLDAQWAVFVGTDRTAWRLMVSANPRWDPSTGSDERSFTVEWGTTTSAPDDGEGLPAFKRPARYVERTTNGGGVLRFVVLDYGHQGFNRLLTVGGTGVSRDDLIRIAQHLEVLGDPDLSWLGK